MTFADRIEEYEVTKGLLQTVIDSLTPIRDRLSIYNDRLSGLSDSASLETLEVVGVRLTIEGENLTEESWTSERIAEAYNAVIAIVNRIATDSGVDTLFALILFQQVFGGTEIRLLEGNFGDGSYASTSVDGSIIYLYTQPTAFLQSDLDRCGELRGIDDPSYNNCVGHDFVVHLSANIVHEFGHVLPFRYSDSGLFESWDQEIRNFISPFNTTEGWTMEQFNNLQNNSVQEDVTEGHMTQTDLENERIANMFEAWISDIQPDINSTDERQLKRAWAMRTFMTGECPPEGLNIPCSNMGFGDWIRQFGGSL